MVRKGATSVQETLTLEKKHNPYRENSHVVVPHSDSKHCVSEESR